MEKNKSTASTKKKTTTSVSKNCNIDGNVYNCMFQMTEEETQNALENVQAEFANINKPTEETEEAEETAEE